VALKLESVDFKPLTQKLEDFDVTVTVRRATLGDESKRMAALLPRGTRRSSPTSPRPRSGSRWSSVTPLGGPDDEPLLEPGMAYETFVANLTAVWQHSAELF
jgi:hypothetical protein